MVRLPQLLFALLLGLTPASGLAGGWLAPCATARLVASWARHGFWRTPAIYDPPRHLLGNHVRYVGKVRAGGRTYRIYFDQNADPETRHGSQDLIVLDAAGRFLGLYDVGESDPVRTKGPDVLFNRNSSPGNRIRFGPMGPPDEAELNGAIVDFSRRFAKKDMGLLSRGPRVSAYCRH